MWTTENRARYNRDQLRYPSDVTDEEWAEIAPLIPPARRGGRKRTVNIREVFNGLAVRVEYRLSVAGAAERVPAAQHGLRLLWVMASRWDVAADSCHTICEVSGAAGAGEQSDGLYHR